MGWQTYYFVNPNLELRLNWAVTIEEPSEKHKQIFTGNIEQQIIVFRRFDNNTEKHEQYKNNIESEKKKELRTM